MGFEDSFPSYDIRASRNASRTLEQIRSFDNLYQKVDIDLAADTLIVDGNVCVVVLVTEVFQVKEPEWSWKDPQVVKTKVRGVANTAAEAQQLVLAWYAKHAEQYLLSEPEDLTPWKKKRKN